MPNDTRDDLVSAVRGGNVDTVKETINAFVHNHELSPWDGYVLLLEAINAGQYAIAKYLLTDVSDFVRNARPGIHGECNALLFSALFVLAAVNCNDSEILDRLVPKNLSAREALLFAAIQHNRLDIVTLLKNDENNAKDLPKVDITPIQFAMQVNKILLNATLMRRRIHVSRSSLPKLMTDKYTANALSTIVVSLLTDAPFFTGRFGKRYYMDYSRCTDGRPLHVAIKAGNSKIVKLLLTRGVKADGDGHDGRTALQSSLSRRHALSRDTERTIILAYVIVSSFTFVNETNLESVLQAVENSSNDYVDVLSNFGRGKTYITRAISDIMYHNRTKNIKVLRSLILHAAVEKGYASLIEGLFECTSEKKIFYNSLTIEGFTLLHTAVTSKQLEIVELLVTYGADTMAKDLFKKTPMYYAIENGDLEITSRLVDFGADIMNMPILLNTAVYTASVDIVKYFLEFDESTIDVNAKDEDGNTPLHSIGINRVTENDKMSINVYQDTAMSSIVKSKIAEMLINRGADIESRNNKQQTPLHVAAKKGYVDVVEVLVKNNADIFVVDYKGATPLHLSTWHDDPSIAKIFINGKADVNARRKDGSLVLRDAIVGGSEKVLVLLLRHGADMNAVCKCGTTLFDCHNLNHYRRVRRLGFGRWLRISDVIKRHIIKLKSADLPVTEGNLRALNDITEHLKKFGDNCRSEIELMRKSRISRNVCFYDIATSSEHQMAIYARFTSVTKAVKSLDWKKEFPIYHDWIEENLSKARAREGLLVAGVDCLNHLAGRSIPDVFAVDILGYLKNNDLENLIEAGFWNDRKAVEQRRRKINNKRRWDNCLDDTTVANVDSDYRCPRCSVLGKSKIENGAEATDRSADERHLNFGPTPAKLRRSLSSGVASNDRTCSVCSKTGKTYRTRSSSLNR